MQRIAILSTSSLAVLVLGFNLVVRYDSVSDLGFWVGVILFLVAFWGWYVCIIWAKALDDAAEKARNTLFGKMDEIIKRMK